jgi:CDP-diacylglycerol--glycerol-3-phosphate 3-phosphatidyltransferase
MNWANRLTVSRLGLTILFVLALNSEWPFAYTLALVLFIIAGITDYVDGEIARRYQFVTNFGKLMDPLVDKIMIAAAFISLVALPARHVPGAVPAWAAIVIVAREFLITGLRLVASSQGQVLPAEKLGKHKTSWQIVTVIFFLLLLATRELRYADNTTPWWVHTWTYGGAGLVWITVALTLYSGLRYAWRHRAIIATEC